MADNTEFDKKPVENIEIFSTDDEKIKSIGELLTNDSSRAILQLLFKEEMTATQLAQNTEESLQLVKYHLNKMQGMGVVKVSKIEKNTKSQDMKYYKATKFAIVILPSAVSNKAKESKLLLHSFRTIYRFVGIGVAAVASWFATKTLQGAEPPPMAPPAGHSGEIAEYMPTVPDMPVSDMFLQFLVPIIVIAIGVIIELYLRYRRRKIKKGRVIN